MAKILNKDPFTYQQEKDEFLTTLKQFHKNRGTPIGRNPHIGGKEVDLYLLYRQVIKFGGWRKITDEQIWENLLPDFRIPRGCSNGTQALKFIYVRYLDAYEKIYFHGADPHQRDTEEETEGPLRKKTCLPLFGIPHSYNYDQHKVSDYGRSVVGMSMDFVRYGDYEKLEKALLSGLPNEVDFAVNVCTLLSNESRHTLLLSKAQTLLQLLMAHIGIFDEGDGSYEDVYEEGWRTLSNKNFISFWYQTVDEEDIRKLVNTKRAYTKRDFLGQEVLNLGQEQGVHDQEGQRVMQMAVIIRNLSFEEGNMKFMSENGLVIRFIMLCIHSNYGCLRQLALDMLGNIAEKFVLSTDDHSQLVLCLLKKCLSSNDKYEVVRGLEILSKLCVVDENEGVLTESLNDELYADIVRLMNVFDIQIIVYSLEALYQLSELGEHTTTKIAAVKHAVDMLVSLLTIEAQSYGPNSLVGIKVVEYCPPPHLVPGGTVHDQGQTTAMQASPGHPISQPLPPSQKTSQQQFGGSSGCDVETTTYQWLQSTFETKDGSSMSQVHMYAEYLNFAKKFTLPQILSSQAFISCVKVVYPNLEQYTVSKPEGVSEVGFKGICKRKTPLPFAIPSTFARSSHCVMANQNIKQSPTLRQRLMEPPKLSALQASPLLPLGGAASSTNNQQNAIYTSTKPQTHTSTSGSKTDQGQQITQKTHNPQPKTQLALKQHLNQSSPTQRPVLPQQTGPPNSNVVYYQTQNLQSPNDTRMIKTLLAKKLKIQSSPIPIAPKQSVPVQQVQTVLDTSNPMHLLTFTTQQSSVIQGQLHQTFPAPLQENGVYSVANNFVEQSGQSVQIQGIQSIVDGAQQYVIPQQSVASSSHSSRQSRPPKADKGKGASKNSRNSSRSSRSSSPKGASPKRKSSSSSRSNSPRAVCSSPGSYDFEVCGGVERAKDVVQVGLEARIERIENNSIKQIQNVKNPTPSITSSIIPQVSVNTALTQLPDIPVIGSTNTGQTGNYVKSTALQSDSVITEPSQCSSHSNPVLSSEGATSSFPRVINQAILPSNSNESLISSIACSIQNSSSIMPQTTGSSSNTITDNDFSHSQNVMEETDNSAPQLKEKPKMNYICTQDETDAAVSSLLITEEDSQQSLSTGSDADVGLSAAIVNSTDETEAAISALAGMLEADVDEDCVDVAMVPTELPVNNHLLNDDVSEQVTMVTDVVPEHSSDILQNGSDENVCGKPQNILYNGVLESPEENQIPSPTEDKIHMGNGISESESEEGFSVPSKDVIDKMALEKVVKINGISKHIGNGDLTSDIHPCNDDSVQDRDVSSGGDHTENVVKINGDIDKMEVDEPESVIVENGTSIDIMENGEPTGSKCYELAGEIDNDEANEEEEVLIENEMFLQPSNPPVVEPENVEKNSQEVPETNGMEIDGSMETSQEEEECKIPVDGCVDILKAAIESEKIDECVLNGDSNDSLPQGEIYTGEIQISSGNIPIGNEMTTAVGSNSINLIPNVFTNVQTVQTGLVVGTIVSLNNNILTTAQVPLTLGDNIVNKKTTMEICSDRHVPTPEVSRDNELSCDSIASSITDPSDKHSITFQQPVLSVQNFPTATNFLSVQTVPAKAQQYITTVVATLPNQTSPRTREKRPKKRNRNASSGSGDSKCSSNSSSFTPPISQPQSLPEFMCEWNGCKQCFENFKSVFHHVYESHLKYERDGYCRWEGCEKLHRKKWSVVTHVQDHHCSENALKTAVMRRKQSQHSGTTVPPQTVPALVYPNDAAWQAIRRFAPKPPFPEFTEAREGPVTKHIRLTAALVLRNLARYSAPGRSLIKRYEQRINYSAMSALESSNALANCLFEILHDH